MHKWIGTYNLYLTCITRFFKWFYYPDENHTNRPKSKVVENIPQFKRKEVSTYTPSDLWSLDGNITYYSIGRKSHDRQIVRS